MEYEVDFLPVGEGEKSGDAIAIRCWNSHGSYVFVIDGGTLESGEALVEHIRMHYGTNKVYAVISTHPDGDHASGLRHVLEQMEVDYLLMHQPWKHAAEIKALFEKDYSTPGLERKIREGLQYAHELEQIANRKSITIIEPFTDINSPAFFKVLGPTREYYQSLIPQFRSTPDAKFSFGGLVEKTKDFAEKAIEWVEETLHMSTETLTDGNEHFSAENNSSVISLFIFDGKKFLFTGDADAEAIGHALDYAISQGISVDDIEVLHVPHHGSKHNVGPTLLNRLKVKAAQISASPNASKHPSKKVINAFLRRGSLVYHNGKQVICHKSTGAPLRRGYGPVQSLPFNAKVEK